MDFLTNQVSTIMDPTSLKNKPRQEIWTSLYKYILIIIVVLVIICLIEWQIRDLKEEIRQNHDEMMDRTTDEHLL